MFIMLASAAESSVAKMAAKALAKSTYSRISGNDSYFRNVRVCFYTKNAEVKRIKEKVPQTKNGISSLKCNCDIIGPPDDETNLRPVMFYKSPEETELEKEFRIERKKVQDWNNAFWRNHNIKFIQESKAFQTERLRSCSDKEKKTLNAEEMSEFYKAYLDKNWRRHVSYNFEWYYKNAYLVYLAWKIQLSKVSNLFKKVK